MLVENTSILMVVIACLFGLGMIGYFIVIALAFIFEIKALSGIRDIVLANLAFNLGLPVSAMGAFGVVAVFWSAFPQPSTASDAVGLEFLGLSFTGPSGPITLWVVCFLSLVFAMYLLRTDK